MHNVSAFFGVQVWTNKGKTTIKTITERCLSNASSHQVSFRASYSCFFFFLSHKEPALGQEMCIRAAPFLCCARTSKPVTWGVMSVVTVTRQSKHHFTDDLKIKKQKTAKHGCKGVLRIIEATDLSHCLVVLGGETKNAGWSGALYSIEREIARSTASLLTLM